MEKIKQFLESVPNAKILDVGTGRGNFISLLDYLYKDYEEMIGIDIIEQAVISANKQFEENKKIYFLNQDINSTDFPDDYFDIVCLSNSLHHLDNIDTTFRNMERLVKPGGFILLNEMMKDNLNEKQISHKLLHHFSAKIDREMGRFHDDTFNRLEIVEKVKLNSTFRLVEYWDMITPKQDASNEEVEHFSKTVDYILNQLSDSKKTETILKEAKDIKAYILNHGVEGCTQLLVVVKNDK